MRTKEKTIFCFSKISKRLALIGSFAFICHMKIQNDFCCSNQFNYISISIDEMVCVPQLFCGIAYNMPIHMCPMKCAHMWLLTHQWMRGSSFFFIYWNAFTSCVCHVSYDLPLQFRVFWPQLMRLTFFESFDISVGFLLPISSFIATIIWFRSNLLFFCFLTFRERVKKEIKPEKPPDDLNEITKVNKFSRFFFFFFFLLRNRFAANINENSFICRLKRDSSHSLWLHRFWC